MRTIVVRDNMRIPLGKQGENNAVRVVWPKIAEKYAKLYGDGRFELVVVQKGKAYPAVVSVDGTDLVWDVLAADVATAEVGSLELIYYAGDTIAKSQTWETMVIASKSADGMTEPPEDPAKSWFAGMQSQIGDVRKLKTDSKDNLVSAINEVKEDIVQSDWNQNDSSAKDYVKNRTHWVETVSKTVIPEQTVTTELHEDKNGALLSISDEQQVILADAFNTKEAPTFSVVFDDVKYSVRWFETNGNRLPILGNFSLIQPNVPDTGEPFCVFPGDSQLNICCKTSGTHTITASLQMMVVHTIDHKYIGQISPDEMGDVSEDGVWSVPHTSELSPEFWADDFSYFDSAWLTMSASKYPISIVVNGKMFNDLPYSSGDYGAYTLGDVDTLGVQIRHPERNQKTQYLTVSSEMFPDGVQSVRIFKTVPVRIAEDMLPESAEWVAQNDPSDFVRTDNVQYVTDLEAVQRVNVNNIHFNNFHQVRHSIYMISTPIGESYYDVVKKNTIVCNTFTGTKTKDVHLPDGTVVTSSDWPLGCALIGVDFNSNPYLLNPRITK